MIICVSNLRNHRDYSREEIKLFPQFWLSLPNNVGPDKYLSGHNLKNMGKKQKFDYAKHVIWMRNFYFLILYFT